MVYGDVTGRIGWQLIGEAPRRRKGWGTLPLPGWDPEGGWEADPVPFEQMPYLADPKVGFVATANNRPTREGEGPYLGSDWLDGYRLARIVEALGNWADWDVESTLALQLDQTSMPWLELREPVLGLDVEQEGARQALALLEAWDGKVAANSPAAAVYEFFVAEMAQRIAQCKAPRTAAWALGKGFTPTNPETMFFLRRMGHLCRLVREQPPGWFEPSWEAELADALSTVVDRLRERHGDDPAGWAWGRIRTLTLQHAVGGQAPLDRVFNLGPFAWGGDGQTVGHGAVRPRAPGENPDGIASLRMVVEVGDWEAARFVLPGGQSGNPLSPHYDDQLELWQQGEGIPIAWAPEKVAEAGQEVLRLETRG
jgi:penicillin amidase